MRDGSVACLKVRYYSAPDAAEDLARIATLPSHRYKPVRAYHCPWCAGFHLTHKP